MSEFPMSNENINRHSIEPILNKYSRLYHEILRRHPNINYNQLITLVHLFNNSPWYKKLFYRWSVVSYLTIDNLNAIEKLKYNDQRLAIQWFRNPDFSEIAKTPLVMENFLLLYKFKNFNPIEFIIKCKHIYSKNHNSTQLSNSAIRVLLNFDFMKSIPKETKNLIPFDYDKIPKNLQNEVKTEYVLNAFENFCSNYNYVKNKSLIQNPYLVLCFYLAKSNYIILPDFITSTNNQNLTQEISNYIYKNYNTISNNFLSEIKKKSDNNLEKLTVYFDNLFGFVYDKNQKLLYNKSKATVKLNSISDNQEIDIRLPSIAPTIFHQIGNFINLHYSNPVLTAITVLQNPEKINKVINELSIQHKLANILQNNQPYVSQFPKILAHLDLSSNLAKNLSENGSIKQLCPQLEQNVLEEKKKFDLENFTKEIPTEVLIHMKKNDFTAEKITALKQLGNLIDELPTEYIDFVKTNPDSVEILKNIAEAKNYENISEYTKTYFQNIENYNDPLLEYFMQKPLQIICNLVEELKDCNILANKCFLTFHEQIDFPKQIIRVFLTKIKNYNLPNIILSSNNTRTILKTEIEIRDILNDINNNMSTKTQALWSLANCMKLNAINEKYNGIPDEENDSLYIIEQVAKRLPETHQAKTIFTEILHQDYTYALKKKLQETSQQHQFLSSTHPMLQTEAKTRTI